MLEVFAPDNHINTRLVTGTLLTENGDKEIKYRAGRLTHFGLINLFETFTSEGQQFILEQITKIQDTKMQEIVSSAAVNSLFSRIAPIMCADRDRIFPSIEELFKLLEFPDTIDLLQQCADAAIELNPALNQYRASVIERRKEEQAKKWEAQNRNNASNNGETSGNGQSDFLSSSTPAEQSVSGA
jgi:hypothetical protein